MASGNINLRDPALYRIKKVPHQNTGDACRSIRCTNTRTRSATPSRASPFAGTLEFETTSALRLVRGSRRRACAPALLQPLLDKGSESGREAAPIEFSRLNINYTVMSKRKLVAMVAKAGRRLGRSADADLQGTAAAATRRVAAPLADASASASRICHDFDLENCLREDLAPARRGAWRCWIR